MMNSATSAVLESENSANEFARAFPALGEAIECLDGHGATADARLLRLTPTLPVATISPICQKGTWFTRTGIYLIGGTAGITLLAFIAVVALSQGLGR